MVDPQHLRLYTRLDGMALLIFLLSLVLLMYIQYGSCASYLESWLGYLPMVSPTNPCRAGSQHQAIGLPQS